MKKDNSLIAYIILAMCAVGGVVYWLLSKKNNKATISASALANPNTATEAEKKAAQEILAEYKKTGVVPEVPKEVLTPTNSDITPTTSYVPPSDSPLAGAYTVRPRGSGGVTAPPTTGTGGGTVSQQDYMATLQEIAGYTEQPTNNDYGYRTNIYDSIY